MAYRIRMMILLYAAATLYLLLLAGLYVFQRRLMYLPDTHIAAPRDYGLVEFEEHMIQSADGTKLQLWTKRASADFPTVVYFHGNASHLGNRAGIYHALAEKGFGVVALSYRGYGKSGGEPTEAGLYDDARAAIRFASDVWRVPARALLLFGESLGTGVAVQMATEFDVAGIALQAPYTSVVNRAAELYFYVPVRWLIHDHYDSIAKAPSVRAPVILFHGELDTTIPVAHGKKLLTAFRTPVSSFFFPHIGHTDFDSEILASHLADFAKTHGALKP